MPDGKQTYVPPAIDLTAFNCPHCGAYAEQRWHQLASFPISERGVPLLWGKSGNLPSQGTQFSASLGDQSTRDHLKKPGIMADVSNGSIHYVVRSACFSKCFHCNELCIWVYDRLIWPQNGEAPPPNPDLPDDIKADYLEASAILDLSPRGAAALLRLAVQKLCRELGEKGKNIDDDIRGLVRKGLDSRVQKALDIVRVIGNNAVHPGQVDLSDDRQTAETLFSLVNLISDIMISEPKRIDDMYEQLPEGARAEIARKDRTDKDS